MGRKIVNGNPFFRYGILYMYRDSGAVGYQERIFKNFIEPYNPNKIFYILPGEEGVFDGVYTSYVFAKKIARLLVRKSDEIVASVVYDCFRRTFTNRFYLKNPDTKELNGFSYYYNFREKLDCFYGN